jgi:hypothetical protein
MTAPLKKMAEEAIAVAFGQSNDHDARNVAAYRYDFNSVVTVIHRTDDGGHVLPSISH